MNDKHQFPLDYSDFRTDVSKRRRPAATRELTKLVYTAPKRMISLAEGMPNDETFPFTEISVKLYDGSTFTLVGDELAQALQYLPSQGYPPLLQALRDFQRRAHAPPLWESRDIAIVSGSQDGLSKTLEAIVGPGDPLLVHDPFFPGVQIVVAPHKAELIAIPQDEQGTDPDALRDILQRRLLSGKKMPKIMYVNATGTNPTGVILPYSRRQEIYRIACEYNFLILDDDPYHFLHYTEEEPRSFLSLDTEGRVIRLDSFSKLVSAGLRIGFVTAPAPIIASVELHLQSSHLHASSLSQMILYKLMKIWGHEGIIEHFKRVSCFYKKRRDVIVALARKHLNGLADFTVPSSGFFLWIKVRGVKDTWKLVTQGSTTRGVVFAPGAAFMKDPSKPCNALRACFSKCSYEDMNLALESLAQLIREELAANQTIINGNEFRNGKANSSQVLPLSSG